VKLERDISVAAEVFRGVISLQPVISSYTSNKVFEGKNEKIIINEREIYYACYNKPEGRTTITV